jgi:His/Glu/Gln/Arg/opine family amino acid ABC transporter permease subunit
METIIDILIQYHQGFLSGLFVTLKMSLIIWSVGIVIGFTLAVLSNKYKEEIGIPISLLSFILSGMPLLVLLFWLHYPAQELLGVVIDPFYTAVLTLCIANIFGVCQIIRHGIAEFPKQYITAAQVCGVKKSKILLNIQVPLIFRQVFPALLMLQVTMLHTTIFAGFISVEEIFKVAQRINANIYKPVEIYTALGLFFLLVCLPINGFALWLKHKYTRNISES